MESETRFQSFAYIQVTTTYIPVSGTQQCVNFSSHLKSHQQCILNAHGSLYHVFTAQNHIKTGKYFLRTSDA